MSNLVPITFNGSQLPTLSGDFMQKMKEAMTSDFNDLSGGGARFIRPRKSDFLLVDGGNQEVVYGHELFGVLICAAPTNHCVWYAKEFAPGQEPAAPDLIWNQTAPDAFPDALPEQYRRKVIRNGQERWGFQIRRRTIWALCRKDASGQMMLDVSRPYILDLTSMSLFGKPNLQQNAYKFANFKDVCNQYSSNGFICTPSMFVTQIFLDPNVSVTGVVVFRPQRDQQGNLVFLDGQTIQSVYAARMSQEVQDVREVKEKLDWMPDGGVQPIQPVVLPTIGTPVQAPVQPMPQPVQPVVRPAPVPQPAPIPTDPAQFAPQPAPIPTDPAQFVPQPAPIPAAPVQPVPVPTPAMQHTISEARPNNPEQLPPAAMNDLLTSAQSVLAAGIAPAPVQPVPQPAPIPAAPVQAAPQPVQEGVESSLSEGFNNILSSLL